MTEGSRLQRRRTCLTLMTLSPQQTSQMMSAISAAGFGSAVHSSSASTPQTSGLMQAVRRKKTKKFVRAVSNAAANQLNVAYQLLGREAFGPVATETLKLRLGDGHLAGSPLAPPAPAP
mmetsp:Transcript_29556/g.57976  ORF Transcript_29556/g.57976 Transcript_29556/m.57976 type:complete len:119 (+) Transcript_29556:272-628(+)